MSRLLSSEPTRFTAHHEHADYRRGGLCHAGHTADFASAVGTGEQRELAAAEISREQIEGAVVIEISGDQRAGIGPDRKVETRLKSSVAVAEQQAGGITATVGDREVQATVGIEITEDEARGPMGKAKREHIASVLAVPRVTALWRGRFGSDPSVADVDRLYADFLPLQLSVLSQGSDVIPGIPGMIAELRKRGLKIGSSTGYTRALMEAVIPIAREQGYSPDVVLCSDEVPAGRPMPWLNFRACEALGVYPPASVLVVDDTPIGIQAGRNAGMWVATSVVPFSLKGIEALESWQVRRIQATDCGD